jgi:hypothetical protein
MHRRALVSYPLHDAFYLPNVVGYFELEGPNVSGAARQKL